jgi:1-acyl-sn-glycerol-3-phosphate acyltransferase
VNQEKPYFCRLFNPKKFGMDLARALVGPWLLLAYRPKPIFVSKEAKKSLHYHHGCIVTANHFSLHDPFIIGTTFWRRRMFFLAAEFIMKYRFRGWLLRKAGCIGVNRQIADIEAMQVTEKHLEEGDLITVFAEGGIQHQEGPATFKSGAVLMAVAANVPIIPCYFEKRKHWWNRYHVVVGELFDPRKILGKEQASIPEIRVLTEKLYEKTKELEEVLHHDGK